MGADETEQVAHLFAQEVPEIANGLVAINAVARMPGIRSKLAVQSRAPNVDAIGVCVGVRGCHILRIVDQLNGERIELVRWHDALETLIVNALQPAKIERVLLHPAQHRATVIVEENQLSFVVGGRGDQNRELASRLCGLQLDIVTQ